MNVYFVSCRFVFKRIPLLLASPVVMIIFVWCALYVAPVSGPPRPASKFRAYTYIVNRTVEAKFTWKAGYDWKMPQYFELDQKDFDSQIWVEVYKISEESDRSVVLELEHSQKYEFRVRACNIYGCSRSNTPEVQFTTDSTYCIKDGDLLVGKLFYKTNEQNILFLFSCVSYPLKRGTNKRFPDSAEDGNHFRRDTTLHWDRPSRLGVLEIAETEVKAIPSCSLLYVIIHHVINHGTCSLL